MPDVIHKDSFLYLFADDTKVFRKIETKQDVEKLQQDVDSLVKWSKDWLLRFHPDKCVSISFGNHQNWGIPTYYMDDHELRYSPCEKDLGSTLMTSSTSKNILGP